MLIAGRKAMISQDLKLYIAFWLMLQLSVITEYSFPADRMMKLGPGYGDGQASKGYGYGSRLYPSVPSGTSNRGGLLQGRETEGGGRKSRLQALLTAAPFRRSVGRGYRCTFLPLARWQPLRLSRARVTDSWKIRLSPRQA